MLRIRKSSTAPHKNISERVKINMSPEQVSSYLKSIQVAEVCMSSHIFDRNQKHLQTFTAHNLLIFTCSPPQPTRGRQPALWDSVSRLKNDKHARRAEAIRPPDKVRVLSCRGRDATSVPDVFKDHRVTKC